MAFLAVAAICACSALESQAQPAPPNDNLTNAQVIIGVSGSEQGTNLNATVETGEIFPIVTPAGPVIPQSTIWYAWTAPITTEIDFNTRNSTDANGQPLDTTLGVYVAKNNVLSYANLVQVAGNVDDPSGGVTSRVDFQANLGTTYYIQVGSMLDTNDNLGQGFPDLNWAPSLVAGGFGFSTPVFLMSSMENFIPDDSSNSIAPSLFGKAGGTANARITVSRTGGNVGRCEVTLNVTPGSYTNFYFTNYVITNI
jgi:hypothetical protein